MSIDQDRINQFSEYLATLEPVDTREVMRQLGTKACNKFGGVMVLGVVRNPFDLSKVIGSLLTNLDAADQAIAGMAILQVVSARMADWFASPEMADAPNINKVNAQFSAITAQIARLELIVTTSNEVDPLIEPLPSDSIVQAAAETIAGMGEAEGLAAIEAIALAHTQKFPGSILINEPKTGEAIIEFFVEFLNTQSPNDIGFVAMNLIGILARSIEQTLSHPGNRSPDRSKAEAIAVMQQISRTMRALGERTNTTPSRESIAS
jgi:hypothetical protein